jgi:hypothetical protein
MLHRKEELSETEKKRHLFAVASRCVVPQPYLTLFERQQLVATRVEMEGWILLHL